MMDVEFPRRERDFVDLARVDQSLRDAATLALSNNIGLYEGDTLLPAPAHRVGADVARFGPILRHLRRRRSPMSSGPPLARTRRSIWEQGILDVLFEYPIQSDRSYFSIHAAFDRFALKVVTALQFLPPGGIVRAYRTGRRCRAGAARSQLDQAARDFVDSGFFHILGGTDHLLFLLLPRHPVPPRAPARSRSSPPSPWRIRSR